MYSEIANTTKVNNEFPQSNFSTHIKDYCRILDKYGLTYKLSSSNNYYEVGDFRCIQGWILDITAVPVQFDSLLETVLPLLIEQKVAFCVIKNSKIGTSIMHGMGGLLSVGKFISIYSSDDAQAVYIANQLIGLTKRFKGPEIPTDRQLDNVVYTRYGACKGIIQINERGIEAKYIYNHDGNLIPDNCTIPFILPNGIKWPFADINSEIVPKKETVLQERYRPMSILKEDAKGSVKKGLYLEKYWRIKWCVIKEGKLNMFSDWKGRDIADRLRWQYELHNELQDCVPLPAIYDLFEENGDTYLVMEYIKGRSLQQLIYTILKDRPWQSISRTDQQNIMQLAAGVLDIIEVLHANGYIHRDITPANFLVDKGNKLWMIDMELSYCKRRKKPEWPFRLGTMGFMSPEQEETMPPTEEQDIYAIGALLIFLFTGLMPDKFISQEIRCLQDQLSFFIPGNKRLVMLISSCWEKDPKKRPNLSYIKENIQEFYQKESRTVAGSLNLPTSNTDQNTLKIIINNALRGLTHPDFLTTSGYWAGAKENDSLSGSKGALSVSTSFYEGLSGIIWLLAIAKRTGFSILPYEEIIAKNLGYVKMKIGTDLESAPAGLYFGAAGIAMAMVECLKSKLVQPGEDTEKEVVRCLQKPILAGYGIVSGIAGQGISLLKSIHTLNNNLIHQLLEEKLFLLLKQQEKDGSWISQTGRPGKSTKYTGFGEGVAGIALFLLNYMKMYENNAQVRRAAINAMRWLSKQTYKKHGHIIWPLDSSTRSYSYNFQNGTMGIALAMIKAFEVLGDPEYKTMAENCLRSYYPTPISSDLTQVKGLTGCGEVYLEAEKVFATGEWRHRAEWIAEFILHHYKASDSSSYYWLTQDSPDTTAGFMEGNSGIIHFLMRYNNPSLNHPLI